MDFDLLGAIEAIDQNDVFEIANQARPAGNYLFNSILPNRNEDTYDISGGSLTIRTTMAGLSGMDAKYSEGGAAEITEFSGKTGKMTINSKLPEELMRKLQRMLVLLMAQGNPTNDTIQNVALNFVDKIITQAMLDREEWLKGQALFTGAIDWTFNGIRLLANYGIPASNFLTPRTGNDRYGGSTSKFWDDVHEANRLLNWDVRAIILHPTTLTEILNNADVNKLEFIEANTQAGFFTFKRFRTVGGQSVLSTDPRDTIRMLTYNEEGEIWDLANPGKTKKIPFCPVGGILFLGAPISNSRFTIGTGSTQDPLLVSPIEMGYGHVAPTVEGGGRPGRWARVRVPGDEPMQIQGDGVENFLPVIEAEKRIVIANTQIGA